MVSQYRGHSFSPSPRFPSEFESLIARNGQAVITGGLISQDLSAANGRVDLFGGDVGGDGGNVHMADGTVAGELLLSGGTVGENLIGEDHARVIMTGGVVGELIISRDGARLQILGGSWGAPSRTDKRRRPRRDAASTFDALELPAGFVAYDSSTIDLFGFDFSAKLIDANYDDGALSQSASRSDVPAPSAGSVEPLFSSVSVVTTMLIGAMAASTAPMSTTPLLMRATPRWSIAEVTALLLPASMAGLPGSGENENGGLASPGHGSRASEL